jgi:hypothetical protein
MIVLGLVAWKRMSERVRMRGGICGIYDAWMRVVGMR